MTARQSTRHIKITDPSEEHLTQEIKNMKEMLDVSKYKARICTSYYDVSGYGLEIDYSEFINEAKANERKKNFQRAIWIYKILSEVIAENMDCIDDSDGYHSDCFVKTVQDMSRCIKRQNTTHEQKRHHILYLWKKFIQDDPDYFEEYYEEALKAICTNKKDLEYWKSVHERMIPKKIPNRRAGFSVRYKVHRLLRMYETILMMLKDRSSLSDFYTKYYRFDSEVCINYIKRLKRVDHDKALQIAQEGCKIFDDSQIREMTINLYKRRDPKRLLLLKKQVEDSGNRKYYAELKRLSDDWPSTLESIIDHYHKKRWIDGMIALMLKENMFDRAMTVIETDRRDIIFYERYHNDMCTKYPQRYYALYKRRLARFNVGSKRKDYKRFRNHLEMMKSVPEHKKEFERFITTVRKRYVRRPALLDEIRLL